MDNSKKLKKQLIALQEELYRDYPSRYNFKTIMETIKDLIDPVSVRAYDEIWNLYNEAPDFCTNDGEPYKDFNQYIGNDTRNGTIRDGIISQIYTITRENKIELKDNSLDRVNKTNKSKLYFILRYLYNDITKAKISFVLPDGTWMPVDTSYLFNLRDIFEDLKDDEMINIFNRLLGSIEMKTPPTISNNEVVSAICQPPEMQCVNMDLITGLEATLKTRIDAESDTALINSVNGMLDIMSFGRYGMVDIKRMIDLCEIPPCIRRGE